MHVLNLMKRIKELQILLSLPVAMQTLKQHTAASFRPQTVYKDGQVHEASTFSLTPRV